MNEKPTEKEIHQKFLKEQFQKLKKIKDIDEYVDFFNSYITIRRNYPRKATIISLQDLTFFLYGKQDNYTSFKIPKRKKGKFREINAPLPKLKMIQRILHELFEYKFTPKQAAHGFIKGRSIVTNARKHVKRKYVYNIDLKNYFTSINFGRVKAVLKLSPLNLNDEQARIIASLCCNKGVLSQGSPTSPIISNMVCRRLDSKLSQFAKKKIARFTRYADDITFSSNKNFFDEDFRIELTKIIISEGLQINEDKVRLQTYLERQMVTGLIVNKKLNVTSKYKCDLRFILNRFLYDRRLAQEWVDKNYKPKTHKEEKPPKVNDYIKGKFSFYKMVVGKKNHDNLVRKYIQKELKKEKYEEGEIIQKQKLELFEALIGKEDIDYKKLYSYYKYGRNLTSEIDKSVNKVEKIIADYQIREEKEFFYKKSIFDLERNLVFLKSYPEHIKLYNQGKKLKEKLLSNELNQFSSVILEKYKINPFDKIDVNLMNILSAETEQKNHFPSELVNILALFKDKENGMGNLLHTNKKLYKKVIRDCKDRYSGIGQKQKIFSIKRDVPNMLNEGIKYVFKELASASNMKKYGNQKYEVIFDDISPFLYSFRKSIRFGDTDIEMKIYDLIVYQMNSINSFFEKFWFIEMPNEKELNSIFKEVFTSTISIGEALKIIFTTFKDNSKGIGHLKITARRWNNKVVLRIIDIESKLTKTSEELKANATSGDFSSIINFLTGYCDVNIRAEFQGGQFYKIPLLPKRETQPSEYYKPEGFTFELIFHKPIKILLLDNNESLERLQKARDIIKTNSTYSSILKCKNKLNTYDSLSSYNAILVHRGNEEFQYIEEHANNERTPIIIFSGEGYYERFSKSKILMSDEDFYNCLPSFLQDILSTNFINFKSFELDNSSQKNISKNKSTKDFIKKLWKDKTEISNLDNSTRQAIMNIINSDVEIPNGFKSLNELELFIKQNS